MVGSLAEAVQVEIDQTRAYLDTYMTLCVIMWDGAGKNSSLNNGQDN